MVKPCTAARALLATILLACAPSDEASEGAGEPTYKEVTATRGAFRIAVSATGLVRPIDRIELKSKASGAVVQLPIEVGDAIAEGGLVAKLDQVEERADLAQAKANLDVAKAELALAKLRSERREQLFESDVIAKEIQDQTQLDLAVARGRLVQTRTMLERAQERMEDTVILSPVTGVVLQKYVERGQIIASGISNVGGGTPIADVADMRSVHVEAGVDEIDIGTIAVGQQATVRAEAFPDRTYLGQVVRIAPEARVEQNVTLFDVVIEVENEDGLLKSGMNATVEIVLVDEPDTLTIPVAALQARNGDGEPADADEAVVLLKRGDAYEPVEIRTGRSNFRTVEVLEGLGDGDVLGIPMASRLKDAHERIQDRIKQSRSFGKPDAPKKPKSH
jgi:HlyD family secretion protein